MAFATETHDLGKELLTLRYIRDNELKHFEK